MGPRSEKGYSRWVVIAHQHHHILPGVTLNIDRGAGSNAAANFMALGPDQLPNKMMLVLYFDQGFTLQKIMHSPGCNVHRWQSHCMSSEQSQSQLSRQTKLAWHPQCWQSFHWPYTCSVQCGWFHHTWSEGWSCRPTRGSWRQTYRDDLDWYSHVQSSMLPHTGRGMLLSTLGQSITPHLWVEKSTIKDIYSAKEHHKTAGDWPSSSCQRHCPDQWPSSSWRCASAEWQPDQRYSFWSLSRTQQLSWFCQESWFYLHWKGDMITKESAGIAELEAILETHQLGDCRRRRRIKNRNKTRNGLDWLLLSRYLQSDYYLLTCSQGHFWERAFW